MTARKTNNLYCNVFIIFSVLLDKRPNRTAEGRYRDGQQKNPFLATGSQRTDKLSSKIRVDLNGTSLFRLDKTPITRGRSITSGRAGLLARPVRRAFSVSYYQWPKCDKHQRGLTAAGTAPDSHRYSLLIPRRAYRLRKLNCRKDNIFTSDYLPFSVFIRLCGIFGTPQKKVSLGRLRKCG